MTFADSIGYGSGVLICSYIVENACPPGSDRFKIEVSGSAFEDSVASNPFFIVTPVNDRQNKDLREVVVLTKGADGSWLGYTKQCAVSPDDSNIGDRFLNFTLYCDTLKVGSGTLELRIGPDGPGATRTEKVSRSLVVEETPSMKRELTFFPSDFPLSPMPGSKVQEVFEDLGRGGLCIRYSVDKSRTDVEDYYRSRLCSEGWTMELESAEDEGVRRFFVEKSEKSGVVEIDALGGDSNTTYILATDYKF